MNRPVTANRVWTRERGRLHRAVRPPDMKVRMLHAAATAVPKDQIARKHLAAALDALTGELNVAVLNPQSRLSKRITK